MEGNDTMTDKNNSTRSSATKPSFLFFRYAPPAAECNPYLYNSLQTFESGLLLLAFRRYPSALVDSISAIESLLRGHFKCINDPSVTLNGKLLQTAGRNFPRLREISEKTNMPDAVQLRNEIIHSGFSPQDDRASMDAFMGAALPFYRTCLEEMIEFDLFDSLFEGYRLHIDRARNAFYEAERRGIENRVRAISALTAFMRWQEMQNTAPDDAYASLQGATNEGFDRAAGIREQLEAMANCPWAVDCPVCESPGYMIVDLDVEALDEGHVTGKHAICANCGYDVGGPWDFMVNILVGAQLEKSKDEIINNLTGGKE